MERTKNPTIYFCKHTDSGYVQTLEMYIDGMVKSDKISDNGRIGVASGSIKIEPASVDSLARRILDAMQKLPPKLIGDDFPEGVEEYSIIVDYLGERKELDWIYIPPNQGTPTLLRPVIDEFEKIMKGIKYARQSFERTTLEDEIQEPEAILV